MDSRATDTPAPDGAAEAAWAPQRVSSSDATPHLPTWEEWSIRIVALIALAYTIYYLVWRWTESLNPAALWFAVPLVVAETYGFVTSLYMVFTVWKLKRRTPPPAPEGLSVDVFITAYDEPLEILRRTAMGARAIRYPHQTYLLDDGKRDEVKAMAEELGIGYIRREGNEHAKAGNLNNALRETSGEFILQLDADHVPLPTILDRLLGFFEDPKVAFVQSPQDFYNTDSFTHDVNEEARRMWEEQRIFFSLIQPGKDHWNAAFFCGSCGVIRRSAFEEIGGFSTETITEDMETSLILHARGWKSVYYGESLAYGLAPANADAFHIQRLRWGQGSMQIFRKFNPLTYPGLTLPQRICYFASVSSYLDGIHKLVLYLAPIIFFFTGAFPIAVSDGEFLAHFLPYLVLQILMFELLSRGTGFLWIAERYNMAKFFTYTMAVSGYFARGKLKFKVTPKEGTTSVSLYSYAPQLTLMIISALAVVWATAADNLGWISYDVAGWGSWAFRLNFVWLAWNFGLAGYVVQLSLYLRQQRTDHRFADRFPIRVRLQDDAGTFGPPVVAISENLNSGGLAFRTTRELDEGSRIKLSLPLSTREIEVLGRVQHVDPIPGSHVPTYLIGTEFVDVDLDTRDAIEIHCFHHAVPIWQMQYRNPTGLLTRTAEWISNARGARRRQVRLPAQVTVHDVESDTIRDSEHLGIIEDISPDGMRLVLERPISPGTHIDFQVAGTDVHGEGIAVFSSALETPIGVRFAVGVHCEDGHGLDRASAVAPLRAPHAGTAGAVS